jgi:hypothetical protein
VPAGVELLKVAPAPQAEQGRERDVVLYEHGKRGSSVRVRPGEQRQSRAGLFGATSGEPLSFLGECCPLIANGEAVQQAVHENGLHLPSQLVRQPGAIVQRWTGA